MAGCPQIENWMTNILDSKYCTFLVSLFATILSFADPITDILTLVEFYRDSHKTWFAVGLAFVVLPCMAFFVLMYLYKSYGGEVYLCGFNPFSSAWVRLKICWSNFRKCCWDANSNDDYDDYDDYDPVYKHSNWARLLEAVFESAPQFIIQLYAMSVQQEPVKIIQMISLPVSLLSLGWAFTAFARPVEGIIVLWNVKQKVVLFVIYLFLLSSRLFAFTFFTITYKWWIISVLMIHNVLILIVDTIWSYKVTRVFLGCSDSVKVAMSVLSCCLNWLRDDTSPIMLIRDADKKDARVNQRMLLLSNILFVIENCTMIIIFYRFSPLSNTWYSLPVTVCVCSFSVIGAVARVAQVYFVTKETNRNNVNSPVQQRDNTTEVGNEPSGESIKGVTRFDMMAEYAKLVTNQAGQSTKGDSHSDMMTEYRYESYV